MAALVCRSVLSTSTVGSDVRSDMSLRSDVCSSAASCQAPVALCSKPFASVHRYDRRRVRISFPGRSNLFSGLREIWNCERASWERTRPGEVLAKGTDDSFSTGEMTLEDALKLLGVGEGASFDEILGAKKSLVDSSGGDQDRISQLEAAYDTLLMQSLSLRRSGKVLDSSIRFADVRRAKSVAAGGGPEWLRKALQNSPVAVNKPPTDTVVLQTSIYGALIVWTFASGLSSSSNPVAVASGADTPGFILAVGFGASLYFLRKQNVRLGKATLMTVGGLVAGALLGGLFESWFRVDIVPFAGISSPAIVVSEFVLVSLYLTSLYLR